MLIKSEIVSVTGAYETRTRSVVNGTKAKLNNTKPRKRQCRAQKQSELITNYFTTENLKSSLADLKSIQKNGASVVEDADHDTIGM